MDASERPYLPEVTVGCYRLKVIEAAGGRMQLEVTVAEGDALVVIPVEQGNPYRYTTGFSTSRIEEEGPGPVPGQERQLEVAGFSLTLLVDTGKRLWLYVESWSRTDDVKGALSDGETGKKTVTVESVYNSG